MGPPPWFQTVDMGSLVRDGDGVGWGVDGVGGCIDFGF